jgi:hypothetical protein
MISQSALTRYRDDGRLEIDSNAASVRYVRRHSLPCTGWAL